MMKTVIAFLLLVLSYGLQAGQGYKIGDQATDFSLKNVDGKMVSLADFPNAKGFVVIFTCNSCPYSQAYQDRIITLDKKYKKKGYPVIAINPNDPAVEPAESYTDMVQRAKQKGYTFPYLYDAKHTLYKTYGATNTPHAFLLQKEKGGKLVVRYIGALDDNFQDAAAVKKPYLEDAINALLQGKDPDPETTKAIGCRVKTSHM
jgi:peroxiredoxin